MRESATLIVQRRRSIPDRRTVNVPAVGPSANRPLGFGDRGRRRHRRVRRTLSASLPSKVVHRPECARVDHRADGR